MDEALRIELGVVEKLKAEKDLAIHVNVYNDLGVIYRRRNMNDSAIYYYDKAFGMALELDDKEWLTSLAINLGVFYHNLQHFKEAARYAKMAVKYSKQQADESYR
ncbi:MAG: two-component sensor histidine kinase, partial [Prevotella sp.]